MKIFLIGDSTVTARYGAKSAPQMGIAWRFAEHFSEDVTVNADAAVGGYSFKALFCGAQPDFTKPDYDKTVAEDSAIGKILPLIEKDDWVIVGSTAPNDIGQIYRNVFFTKNANGEISIVKEGTPGATMYGFQSSPEEYASLLTDFCDLVKARGAHLIFVSNECLSRYDEKEKRYLPHPAYPIYTEKKREVAKAVGAWFFDVGAYMREVVFAGLTPDEVTRRYHLDRRVFEEFYRKHGYAGWDRMNDFFAEGRTDSIHFSQNGALTYGNAVIKLIGESDCPLKEKIVDPVLTLREEKRNYLPFRTLSENEWLFPEETVGTPLFAATELETARNGNVLFQLLTDTVIERDLPFTLRVEGANGVTVTPYQLMPVTVQKNSAPRGKMNTTENYDEVKHFVTHRAPFDVYDITAPLDDGRLKAGRVALAVRLTTAETAPAGKQEIVLHLDTEDFSLRIPVSLTVHRAAVPALSESALSVCNWLYPARIAVAHGVELYSDEYWRIFRKYLRHLRDIRSNVYTVVYSGAIILPNADRSVGGTPIRDAGGRIVDFDMTNYEKGLRIAKEMGFATLYGSFVAHWKVWTDTELGLVWDMETKVTTREAYRQLSIYFRRVREMVERNGWQNCFVQTLVDEPQVNNERDYRILGGICRRFLPGIPICDPLETTDIGGTPDIWCVKQSVYEKYLPIYREYQAQGERFTYYTCGYPAGDTMNRVLDLPLSVGRLTFWMCHRYGFEGFLHWGYHVKEQVGPAGNQNIVYAYGDDLAESVRSHGQRVGAEDWELLEIVRRRDPDRAAALVSRGCRTFDDYERDGRVIDAIRHDILAAADEYTE